MSEPGAPAVPDSITGPNPSDPDVVLPPQGFSPRFLSQLLLDAIGIYLILLGLWATWQTLRAGLNIYDEGLILTHSNLILRGQIPNRDFYTNYPRGILLIVAGLWDMFGISGAAPRFFALFLHLVIAVAGGRIAARLAGRRFSWLTCGCILLWMSLIDPTPFAWIAAVAIAFLTIELLLFLSRLQHAAWFFIGGLALGAISFLRHDLFVYFCAGLVLPFVVWLLQHRVIPSRTFRVRTAWAALGLACSLLAFWLPAIISSGMELLSRDLYFDQVRYVLPARTEPLPPLTALIPSAPLPFRLPAALAESLPGAVALALIAPVLAGLALLFVRLKPAQRLTLSLTGTLALACLPQMLGRTDTLHAVLIVAPALVIGVGLAEGLLNKITRWWQHLGLGFITLFLFVFPVRATLRPVSELALWSMPPAHGRLAGLNNAGYERRETLDFIRQNTRPGEGIFVGNDQHRRVIVNDVSLYYLCNRPGVTRYLQFDPGIITRVEVQKQIASDLERKQVRIAILMRGGYADEPNASRKVGSDFLDNYLQEHYDVVGGAANYVWLRRKFAP